MACGSPSPLLQAATRTGLFVQPMLGIFTQVPSRRSLRQCSPCTVVEGTVKPALYYSFVLESKPKWRGVSSS